MEGIADPVKKGLSILPTCCQHLGIEMSTEVISRAQYELERAGGTNDEIVDALIRTLEGRQRAALLWTNGDGLAGAQP